MCGNQGGTYIYSLFSFCVEKEFLNLPNIFVLFCVIEYLISAEYGGTRHCDDSKCMCNDICHSSWYLLGLQDWLGWI